MRMNEGFKKKLTLVGVILFVVFVGGWILLTGPEHIEDTNGAENFTLQTITDQQIIDRSTGSVGGPQISRSTFIGDGVEFSAEKFTGVYEILYDNYILPSDFEVNLTSYEISGGNFKIVVVHEDSIVATLEPGTFVDYRLEDITGYISLRIVGESASFSFHMSSFDYDRHSHAE